MSDTPRTDEWVNRFNSKEYDVPSAAEFARQLEREADQYRRMWEEACDLIKRWNERK